MMCYILARLLRLWRRGPVAGPYVWRGSLVWTSLLRRRLVRVHRFSSSRPAPRALLNHRSRTRHPPLHLIHRPAAGKSVSSQSRRGQRPPSAPKIYSLWVSLLHYTVIRSLVTRHKYTRDKYIGFTNSCGEAHSSCIIYIDSVIIAILWDHLAWFSCRSGARVGRGLIDGVRLMWTIMILRQRANATHIFARFGIFAKNSNYKFCRRFMRTRPH